MRADIEGIFSDIDMEITDGSAAAKGAIFFIKRIHTQVATLKKKVAKLEDELAQVKDENATIKRIREDKRKEKKPAKPRKLGIDDTPVCKTIRECERLPGVIRRQLIARIIDAANSGVPMTHSTYVIGAFSWVAVPFVEAQIEADTLSLWTTVDDIVHNRSQGTKLSLAHTRLIVNYEPKARCELD